MQVKMLTSIAGHADPDAGLPSDFSFACSATVELPEVLAQKWIEAGIAASVAAKAAPAAAKQAKK